MSGARDTGGSAFPLTKSSLMRDHIREPHRFTHDYVTEGGMTMRDWFAGQVVGHVTTDPTVGRGVAAKDAAAHLARVSYAIADAMIAERSK